jgi:DNA topoisomerase-3
MCNVAKYVSDPKARKILQDTDGIGTPATRATIIETLFERHFVERKKTQIDPHRSGAPASTHCPLLPPRPT